jgi:hypothetical protein
LYKKEKGLANRQQKFDLNLMLIHRNLLKEEFFYSLLRIYLLNISFNELIEIASGKAKKRE